MKQKRNVRLVVVTDMNVMTFVEHDDGPDKHLLSKTFDVRDISHIVHGASVLEKERQQTIKDGSNSSGDSSDGDRSTRLTNDTVRFSLKSKPNHWIEFEADQERHVALVECLRLVVQNSPLTIAEQNEEQKKTWKSNWEKYKQNETEDTFVTVPPTGPPPPTGVQALIGLNEKSVESIGSSKKKSLSETNNEDKNDTLSKDQQFFNEKRKFKKEEERKKALQKEKNYNAMSSEEKQQILEKEKEDKEHQEQQNKHLKVLGKSFGAKKSKGRGRGRGKKGKKGKGSDIKLKEPPKKDGQGDAGSVVETAENPTPVTENVITPSEPSEQVEWVVGVDPASGRNFYQNTINGASQWTRPETLGPEEPIQQENLTTTATTTTTTAAETSLDPWVEKIDPTSGRPYYVNATTNETTWEKPSNGTENQKENQKEQKKEQKEKKEEEKTEKPQSENLAHNDTETTPWLEMYHPEHQRSYYVNQLTKESVWVEPNEGYTSIEQQQQIQQQQQQQQQQHQQQVSKATQEQCSCNYC